MPTRRRTLLGLAVTLFAVLVAACTGPISVPPPGPVTPGAPAVTGPIPGDPTIAATTFAPASVGYQQSEFFLSGRASAYAPTRPLTADGKWSVAPSVSAPYTTRAVVYRPIDPARFNGTVVVEWLNVSGGVDAGPDWILAHDELIRSGYAWVGVSVQAGGLNATKNAQPARYAALTHPGDSFSYDIFTQAGRAVRNQARVLLGGLQPRRVLGVGESQSAFRLVTYLDAVAPIAHAYDGYLVHSGFGSGAALSQSPQPSVVPPAPTRLRTDLDVPVLVFETETDLAAGFANARQPDTHRLRTWEVAGTAHYDYYGLSVGFSDPGDGRAAPVMLDALLHPISAPIPGFIECATPINSGPQHWVLQAAFHALDSWVRGGRPPAHGAQIATTSLAPVTFARDAQGNVRGGVRSPEVDAPLAALSGVGQTGSSFCGLFGTTVPLTAAQLAALYPTHQRFVREWTVAVQRGVAQGFLLPADGRDLVQAAADADIGR
jgi:hypothetical protein